MGKRIIFTYVLISLSMEVLMSLHAAIYVLFLRAGNLNLLQINLVNFFFMAAVFLFEIPTGAIADLYGRKRSLVLSNVVFALGFFYYSVGRGFWQFVLAEVVIALAVTMTSGAFRAWVVDSLQQCGWRGSLVGLFRWEGRAVKIAALVGGLLGTKLGSWNLVWPFRLAGIGYVVVVILVQLLVQEKYFQPLADRKAKFFPNIRKIAQDSFNYGLKHQTVFLILSATAVLSFAFQPLNMYWPFWFKEHVVATQNLGYVWAGIIIFSLLGNELVVVFEKIFPRIKQGYWLIGYTAALFILFSSLAPFWQLSLLLFWLHELPRGLIDPYKTAALQAVIPSSLRATVDSFVSMVSKGAAGLGLVVFGFLGNKFGLAASWVASAFSILVLLPLALLFNGRMKIKVD